ncbi:hypothetical protein [Exiguobacterium flavidum]|uniref:hypothetical protein n=1 Tax=Exiguobacterium flavidum TaxID=2184695 RepID=UPI000DF82D84|nr:hypothetical protein [Exiguobacterium flavidum]
MERIKVLRLADGVSFGAVLLTAFLKNTLLTGTHGEGLLIELPPFTLAIWGVIYTVLFVWCVRPIVSYPADRALIEDIGWWFPLNMLFLGASVFIDGYWTIVAMTLALVTLGVIYAKTQHHPNRSPWMRSPFSVYLAWLSVLSFVHPFIIFDMLHVSSLFGMDESMWLTVVIVLMLITSGLFVWTQDDWIFGIVFAWTFTGLYFNGQVSSLQQVLLVLSFLAVFVSSLFILKRRGAMLK